MTWYVEHRRTVQRSGPLMYVPLESVAKYTGFRSVYALHQDVADRVIETGSVTDLSSESVYSDMLFVDFDTADGITDLGVALRTQGIGYELWDTGGRGAHFHIPIVPMVGSHVPRSQRAWVDHHVKGSWDPTIYRPASLIRLPGTWHEKHPGRSKTLVKCHNGQRLFIPEYIPVPKHLLPMDSDSEESNPAEFWSETLRNKCEPGRHSFVVYLGMLAAECGIPHDEGRDAVLQWAATRAVPPMTDEREVIRAYSNGYKRG